jgi:tetratricopeptide (TPR) repeat protein
MNEQYTNFDRIEAYLFGQMTAAEAAEFERAMAADAALAAEVEQQRLEHRAMELLLREELKANLDNWKVEKQSAAAGEGGAKVVPIGSNRHLLYRIAAAAVVLFIVGFFSRQLFFGVDEEALAMQYFEGSGIGSRGDSTDPLSPVYDAMSRQDWRAALIALDGVQGDAFRQTALQLRGECHFRLKEYAAAADTFRRLLDSGVTPDQQDKTEWQLLLAYVAEGKHPDEQRELIERIVGDKGHSYSGEAEKLRGEME